MAETLGANLVVSLLILQRSGHGRRSRDDMPLSLSLSLSISLYALEGCALTAATLHNGQMGKSERFVAVVASFTAV